MLDDVLVSQLKKSLARNRSIKLAYVLGSVVAGRERKDSDFDLAVVVEDRSKIKYEDADMPAIL